MRFVPTVPLSRATSLALLVVLLSACGPEFRLADGTGGGAGAGGEGGGTTSGATSTSGGDGGGATSAGGSTSTGPVTSEDCVDGVDNDQNGLIDCADPACGPGFECADVAPEGWTGFYRVTTGTWPGEAAMSCDDGASPELLVAGPAGAAQCDACSCDPMVGASCAPPVILCFPGSTNCNVNGSGGQDWTQALQQAGSDCTKPTNLLGNQTSLSCGILKLAEPTGGSCEASGGEAIKAPAWGKRIDACSVTAVGAGCGDGKACVARATEAQSLCLRAEGTQSCPGGWSTVVQAYVGGTDTRACSSCECQPTVECKGGGYTFNDNDKCVAGPAPSIDLVLLSCSNVSNLLDAGTWSLLATPAKPGGSCAPIGGQPTGEVKPEGPVTFCCR